MLGPMTLKFFRAYGKIVQFGPADAQRADESKNTYSLPASQIHIEGKLPKTGELCKVYAPRWLVEDRGLEDEIDLP